MKVLITGADGMLGSSICREALKQGYSVRAMVLPDRKTTVLDGLDIELVQGNLLDEVAVAKAVEGCDYIINVAASTQIWPRRSPFIWKVNYEAVKGLVEAGKRNNIKRFVQIGSASSFGHGTKEQPGNEHTPYNDKAYNMDYIDSKYQAQQYLLNEFKTNGFNAVVVNPTYMIGPFDSGPSSGKMMLTLLKGSLPGYSSGSKNFVYSLDVAVAAVNALTLGKVGECYIAGNENLSFEEFFRKVCSVYNIPFKLKKLPNFIVLLVGFSGSLWAKITQKHPKLGYNMAKQAIMTQCFDASKSREELNMPSTPINVAIKSCIQWWKENKYLS